MRPNDLNGRPNLIFSKAELPQDLGHLAGGIGHMVPGGERRRVFRAMADEDPQVVHPGRRVKDVVIVWLAFRQLHGKVIKPGLVAELVRRPRLGADVINNGLSVPGLMHGPRIAASPLISNPPVWSKTPLGVAAGGLGRALARNPAKTAPWGAASNSDKKGLLFSGKAAIFARLLDSLSIPWHGKSSGELGSVMI